jgi:hypothetical protein
MAKAEASKLTTTVLHHCVLGAIATWTKAPRWTKPRGLRCGRKHTAKLWASSLSKELLGSFDFLVKRFHLLFDQIVFAFYLGLGGITFLQGLFLFLELSNFIFNIVSSPP